MAVPHAEPRKSLQCNVFKGVSVKSIIMKIAISSMYMPFDNRISNMS